MDYRIIKLTQGYECKVDAEDYEELAAHKWHISVSSNKTIYVSRTCSNRKKVLMHRIITNCPCDKIVDHINHDGLDNRKSNLRICDKRGNMINTKKIRGKYSKYKGVSYDKNRFKWRVAIWDNNRPIIQKRFDDEIAAAMFYDQKAVEYYGEFAVTNADIGLLPKGV